MIFKKKRFKLGDSVRFQDGEIDEDSGVDMGRWQGRVTKIDETEEWLLVALDSITLKRLSREYLEESEEGGLSWPEYGIGFDSVEPAKPRDTEKEVEETIAELSNSLRWVYLGAEGREINAILTGADDMVAQVKVWEAYLQKTLTFPFTAKISEWQKPGSSLQAGHKVRVMGFEALDEVYGILAKIKKGGRPFVFPLCDLEVVSHNSPNHAPIQLYAVWYANR